MVRIYVQLGMVAEFCGIYEQYTAGVKRICQQIADTMKAEVRAIRNNSVLGTFEPKPKAIATANPYPRQGTSPSVCEILNRGD